jgi:hypothetical protein
MFFLYKKIYKYNIYKMLPKQLKYGSKVESATARSYKTNVAPQNGTGTYNPGDTVIINLPTRNNLVLCPADSTLKFTVNFTNGANANALRWDSCGAHGIIQRIRIFHGSNLLQDIDNYGMLAKMLFDIQVNTPANYGKNNILCGTRNDYTTTVSTPASAAFTVTGETYANIQANGFVAQVFAAGAVMPAANYSVSVLQTNTGDRIDAVAGALLAANAVVSQTYCINLISLLGTLGASNYIPLFAMTSAPLRAEITLVNSGNLSCASLVALAANPYTLTNVEYLGTFIELGDVGMSLIYESLGGRPLQFVYPEYRNYGYTTTALANATLTQIQMPIPAKFSSLKSLFLTFRDQYNTLTYFPYSSVTQGLVDYQFRIGASVMPSKAPASGTSAANYGSTYAEHFTELLKAIGNISDLMHTPSIEKASYTLNTSATINDSAIATCTNSSGSFYIGIDLENYAAASKDTIFAGMNTNTDDIYCIMNFYNRTANVGARIDAFALFDCVFICENNTAYVRF